MKIRTLFLRLDEDIYNLLSKMSKQEQRTLKGVISNLIKKAAEDASQAKK